MKPLAIALVGASLIASFCYGDDIYQYQGRDGVMVFTNKPTKDAKKVKLPPLSVYSAPMTKNDYIAKGYTRPQTKSPTTLAPAPAAPAAGIFNSSGRQQILSEELAREKRALADSQAALDTALHTKLASEKNNPQLYQERLQALRDAITEHQKNITILSNQLGSNN